MVQKYTTLDDLWSEWGDATSAIMKHIEDKETQNSEMRWRFEEGFVNYSHGRGYSVYIAHSGYDVSVNSMVRLHVQATASPDGEISVETNKREPFET